MNVIIAVYTRVVNALHQLHKHACMVMLLVSAIVIIPDCNMHGI